MNCKVGTFTELREDSLKIRHIVFTVEQNIDPSEDIDEYDEISTHVVVYDDNNLPVSTARLIQSDGIYSIGRMATLKDCRGKGYGRIAVEALIGWAKENDVNEIVVHAQKQAEGFYQKLGFVSYGEIYLEVGIEHISMKKEL